MCRLPCVTLQAIRAAITEAFRTPEIIGLFARRQPDGLRERLSQLTRDRRLGKLTEEGFSQQRVSRPIAKSGVSPKIYT